MKNIKFDHIEGCIHCICEECYKKKSIREKIEINIDLFRIKLKHGIMKALKIGMYKTQ